MIYFVNLSDIGTMYVCTKNDWEVVEKHFLSDGQKPMKVDFERCFCILDGGGFGERDWRVGGVEVIDGKVNFHK